MVKLILMRHGESIWNKLNLFTGWVDVPLSEKGIEEAFNGGKLIKDLSIDIIFTSELMRAQMTAMIAMTQHHSGRVPVTIHPKEGGLYEYNQIFGEIAKTKSIPVVCAQELNERMYGELQGLNKAETIEKYGADQVKIWRRSYSTPPPNGESLEMTAARTIPYFKKNIIPCLEQGKHVFVSAHGNSLRAIVMVLDKLSGEEVVNLELGTGEPIIYSYKKSGEFSKERGPSTS